MIFLNREHAGKMLADKLTQFDMGASIVFALPRGGVPVAAEVATALHAPLHVLVTRKIGAPFHPELALGAICEDGDPIWNQSLLSQLRLRPSDLESIESRERKRIEEQIQKFRAGEKLPVHVSSAILVDDGLATGATIRAAHRYLKARGIQKILVAVPIAAASSAEHLREQGVDVVAVEEREDLMAVGEWYADFTQVSDDEVLRLLKEAQSFQSALAPSVRNIKIPLSSGELTGDLAVMEHMHALIVFVHGSGSSRHSPRNRQVAKDLNRAGFGTLLFDLLTEKEAQDRHNVFDIDLLSKRLIEVTHWLRRHLDFQSKKIGFFGASTGAAAAIQAAVYLQSEDPIYALVSRGGRPDLAGADLARLHEPVLLLVGGLDVGVIELNEKAQDLLFDAELSIIEGATHLFEEPGTLEEVSRQAIAWFQLHLGLQQETKVGSKKHSRAASRLRGPL